MRHLSHGNQLKLALSVAFARSRPVLLLDEPTNGLDVFGIEVLNDLIAERREGGLVTVVATHQPTLTPDLFDQALVIDLGTSLYQGSLSGLLDLSPTPDAAPTARLASAFEVLLRGRVPCD
jgi:ABC-type multidrug transport system ATPase subunit